MHENSNLHSTTCSCHRPRSSVRALHVSLTCGERKIHAPTTAKCTNQRRRKKASMFFCNLNEDAQEAVVLPHIKRNSNRTLSAARYSGGHAQKERVRTDEMRELHIAKCFTLRTQRAVRHCISSCLPPFNVSTTTVATPDTNVFLTWCLPWWWLAPLCLFCSVASFTVFRVAWSRFDIWRSQDRKFLRIYSSNASIL